MVWPLVMLAAQLLSKQEQEKADRRNEIVKLRAEQAARLGGNTSTLDAAEFNKNESMKSYGSPQELAKIYGAGSSLFGDGSSSAPTDGATSTTPGSDGLLNPWGPTGGTGATSDIINPWDDDPYGLKTSM